MLYVSIRYALALCSAVVTAAECNADNCARAATGTAKGLQAQRLASCSSFQQCTVTQPLGAGSATTSCPTAIPSFASTCLGSSRYASACSCAGITQTLVTTGDVSTTTALATMVPSTFTSIVGTNTCPVTTITTIKSACTATVVNATTIIGSTITETMTSTVTQIVAAPPPPSIFFLRANNGPAEGQYLRTAYFQRTENGPSFDYFTLTNFSDVDQALVFSDGFLTDSPRGDTRRVAASSYEFSSNGFRGSPVFFPSVTELEDYLTYNCFFITDQASGMYKIRCELNPDDLGLILSVCDPGTLGFPPADAYRNSQPGQRYFRGSFIAPEGCTETIFVPVYGGPF